MGYFETRTDMPPETDAARRPLSSRLADLGDRIAGALPAPRRAPEYTFPVRAELEADPDHTAEFQVRRLEPGPVDDVLPRFPVTRQGYDCDAVDIHIAELEEELDALERQLDEARALVPTRDAVAQELERVGEQTSTILVAAHDEAQETIRLAQAQADTMIADAASYVAALNEEATRKVDELERRASSLAAAHDHRLTELRATAAALQSLAQDSGQRFSAAG